MSSGVTVGRRRKAGTGWIVLALLATSLICPGRAHSAGRVILTKPMSLYGYVQLQYDSTWGDAEDRVSRLNQEYAVGATGYIIDQQLLKYVTGLQIEDTGEDTGPGYTFNLQLTALDFFTSSSRFYKYPHPIYLSYSHSSFANTTVTNYGFGGTWFIPKWFRFFEKGNFVTVSDTSGIERAASAAESKESIWDASALEQMTSELPDEGWGAGGAEEWSDERTLGPTGWGDAAAIWKEGDEKDIKLKKAREEEAKGPRVAVPFPSITLDYNRYEYEQKATGENPNDIKETDDLIDLRVLFLAVDSDFNGHWSLERNKRDEGGEAGDEETTNLFELKHLYRPPEKIRGDIRSIWTLENRLEYENEDSDSGVSDQRYYLVHRYKRRNDATRADLQVTTQFYYLSNEGQTTQTLGNQVIYQFYLKPNLISRNQFLTRYNGGGTADSSFAARAREELLWNGDLSPRLFGYATLALIQSTDTVSSEGGVGWDSSFQISTRTTRVLSNKVIFSGTYESQNSQTLFSDEFRITGPLVWQTRMDTALTYRYKNIGGTDRAADQIWEYTIDLTRPITRRIDAAAGYRFVNYSGEGGGSQSYSTYAETTVRVANYLRGLLRYTLDNVAGSSNSRLEGHWLFNYQVYRIGIAAEYKFYINQNSSENAQDAPGYVPTHHELTITARRNFG